jgi:hypothetical protein
VPVNLDRGVDISIGGGRVLGNYTVLNTHWSGMGIASVFGQFVNEDIAAS